MEKLTKKDVNFESPAKGRDRCAYCVHFLARQDACEIVAGRVLSSDWCNRFKRVSEAA